MFDQECHYLRHAVASFDFAAGEAPENVTVNPDGSLTVSMLGSPAGERPVLLRIGQNGEREQLAAGRSGDTITGNTRDGTASATIIRRPQLRTGQACGT